MLTVEQALEAILNQTPQLPIERVSLLDAVGRILAEDMQADMDLPPFDNSAVDGYAVRAADTAGASATTPVTLRTLADIPAGTWPTETVLPGTAARILTGAPMPPGADTAVMVEDTRTENNAVAIFEAATPGQHLRYRGEDIRAGETVLRAGVPLGVAEIAMLATVGGVPVPTIRPPRVAVVSTGDELVSPETRDVPPGKIRDSNRYTLAALVQSVGAVVHSMTHLPDDPEATEAAFRRLSDPESGADVIVTAGGVSVGDRDFVKPALEKLGRLELWRVAMKPGKPLAFGAIGETLFFGLPGNPVSAIVTFLLFVRPALRKLAGYPETLWTLPALSVRAGEDIPHTPGRREYVRVRLTHTPEGERIARLTGGQGSSMLHSLMEANALLIVPEDSPGVRAGEVLTALETGRST